MRRAVAVALALLAPAVARAEPADPCALAEPIAVAVRETGFDAPRAACLAGSVRLGVVGSALIDTPDFYGTLDGASTAEVRVVHRSGLELSLGARVVDYRFAQNAVLKGHELGGGPLTVGVARGGRGELLGHPLIWAHALRLDLPLTDSTRDLATVAASPAVIGSWLLEPRLVVHGRGALLLWWTDAATAAESRAALALSVDGGLAATSWLGFSLGVEAQGGWYGAGLDHLLVRGGVRVGFGRHRLELGAGAPVAGTERTDLLLRLGYAAAL